jgi:monooxygenase
MTSTSPADGAGPDHVDVLVVGAGLSGIGVAQHLQRRRPHSTYAIVESRDRLGGTWDLFRYPGVRSDSDMHTLGYRLRPWKDARAIADGPAILAYVQDTAREEGIDRHIRFGVRVVRAEFSTADARWSVDLHHGATGETSTMTCGFLFSCSGYYDYDQGFTPDFAGVADFGGTVVHPQQWPAELDTTGKKVVVIGSGATAVTLVPALAESAEHVTMLQRSPTYVVSLPRTDKVAERARRWLPARAAHTVVFWKNVAKTSAIYALSRTRPDLMRKVFRKGVLSELPEGYDVDTHFNPRYDPWDQRLCVVPNGDLFRAISDGRASVVTDHVDTFTPTGIRLRSGAELVADVVVTATGLNLLAFGGMTFVVDGEEVDVRRSMAYRSMMLTGLPNFAFALGYTNASWTLKVDITADYICRLLDHMDAAHTPVAVPQRDASVGEEPFLDFAAGYVQRSVSAFPHQGDTAPWKVSMSYPRDLVALRRASVTEGMSFPATATVGAR